MLRVRRLLRWAFIACLALLLIAAIGLGSVYYAVSSKLPDPGALRNVELQEPLYIYASDGRLIGLFGETRRYPVAIGDVAGTGPAGLHCRRGRQFLQAQGHLAQGHQPGHLANRHRQGRPAWPAAAPSPSRLQGGFPEREYSYSRKLQDMLLAIRIEKMLSKDEILERT